MLDSAKIGVGLLVLTLLAGSSCTQGPARQPIAAIPAFEQPAGTLVPPALGLTQLQLPATPAAPRASSYTEADLFRTGSQFEPALPSSRVLAGESAANFAPAGGADSAAAAYAIYGFAAVGYDREALLQFNWEAAPATGEMYVGLSDYDAGHWRWFSDPPAVLEFGELEPFLAPDDTVYVAVVVTGSAQATLGSLRLGEVYPAASLSVTPDGRTAPLPVQFDASGSSTPEGTLTLFEWDFDGDDVFETDSGSVPTTQHTYDSGGTFTPAVRVTNSAGHTASASAAAALEIQDEWQHTVGDGGYVMGYTGVATGPDKSIYAVGHTIAYLINYDESYTMLAKWSRDGDLLWSYRGDRVGSWPQAVAVDASGNVIIAGNGGVNGFIHKWSADGEALWSKDVYKLNTSISFDALCVVGTDIYVCGLFDESSSDPDALIACFNGDGELVWARTYDWFNNTAVNIAPRLTPGGVDSLYLLIRTEKTTVPTRTFPLVAVFNLDGTFLSDACPTNIFGGVFDPGALQVVYDPAQPDSSQVYLTFEAEAGSPDSQLWLTKLVYDPLGLTRTVVYQQYWDGPADARAFELLVQPDGDTWLAGTAADWGTLWRSDAAGQFVATEAFVPLQSDSDLQNLLSLDGRLVCCGTTYKHQGEWSGVPFAQGTFDITWGLAAGLVSNETLTVADDNQDFSAMPDIDIDSTEINDQALISYRAMP